MMAGLSGIKYLADLGTVSIMMTRMDTLGLEEANTCQASTGTLGQSNTIVLEPKK